MNYTYRSPLSVFFRIGANYNFFYNSNPDYSFSPAYATDCRRSALVDDVTLARATGTKNRASSIPGTARHCRMVRIQPRTARSKSGVRSPQDGAYATKSILHRSKNAIRAAWYVPGFGAPGAISGSFSFSYTLPLKRSNKTDAEAVINSDTIPDLSRGSIPGEADGTIVVGNDTITVQ